MVLDDFLNNKIQEFLGEFRVEIGPFCKVGQTRDLLFFAVRIGGGQGVLCFENTHGLRVFEPLAQRIDKDRVKPVDAFAVAFEDVGGACGCIGHKAPKIDM